MINYYQTEHSYHYDINKNSTGETHTEQRQAGKVQRLQVNDAQNALQDLSMHLYIDLKIKLDAVQIALGVR